MKRFMGLNRTECACDECVSYCKTMPGYLLPQDLPNILTYAPYTFLRASKGAVVLFRGERYSIPTIVPKKHSRGCVFLTRDERCYIHKHAPFGCAFFDDHRDPSEATFLRIKGLETLIDEWRKPQSAYVELWWELKENGRHEINGEADPVYGVEISENSLGGTEAKVLQRA